MNYDIIIIGGGAAGLFTAVNAKRPDNSVLIIEHGSRAGKKILSTGNGRCNLTNSYCRTDLFGKNPEGIYPYFTSGSRKFIETVINNFDSKDAVIYFESLGVLTEDKSGYIYPRSEQASTVNNVLRKACEDKGVDIATDVHADSIKVCDEGKGRFCVNGRYFCSRLVIACGGMAAPSTGSDGSLFEVIRDLGHTVIKPLPALCPISCSDRLFKELAGVRNDSVITLTDRDGNVLITSHGNLQFTASGISGIPVFQISSVFSRTAENNGKMRITVDLLPEIDEETLAAFIDSYIKEFDEDRLPPVLNSKLINVIGKLLKQQKSGNTGINAEEASKLIKHFPVTPVAAGSFDSAQTTSGGVSTDEIDPETMESKIVPGLYFAGEVIDVNGICGGYNLQWAWSTAHIASEAL